jgi:succinate dehydrogenase/fumarate reductase flavoprotein subunit
LLDHANRGGINLRGPISTKLPATYSIGIYNGTGGLGSSTNGLATGMKVGAAPTKNLYVSASYYDTGNLIKADGTENPFKIWRELGELMTKNVTVIRYNKNLQETDPKIVEFMERFNHINLSDKTVWSNSTFMFARQLYNMLQLARVITQGALLRNESRGSHYKPDFPERDDANFLKTTKAYFAADADEPRFEFAPVDTSLIPPRARKY